MGDPNPQVANLALGVILVGVVVLQTAFNAWQDVSTSRVMASIQDMLPDDVIVLRDGAEMTLPATSLVPGDIIQLSIGKKIPADVKLIDASGDLRFDRSVLTGEVGGTMRVGALKHKFLCSLPLTMIGAIVERAGHRTLGNVK